MFLPVIYLPIRYEINTCNAVLFDHLTLNGVPEVLPGRLFTTRMPRNIKNDPRAADAFKSKVKRNNLSTILVLTEVMMRLKQTLSITRIIIMPLILLSHGAD